MLLGKIPEGPQLAPLTWFWNVFLLYKFVIDDVSQQQQTKNSLCLANHVHKTLLGQLRVESTSPIFLAGLGHSTVTLVLTEGFPV